MAQAGGDHAELMQHPEIFDAQIEFQLQHKARQHSRVPQCRHGYQTQGLPTQH